VQALLADVRAMLSRLIEETRATLRDDGRGDTDAMRALLTWSAAFGGDEFDGVELDGAGSRRGFRERE
jgi:hypothetical protein